jgi:hypothetical protein
MITARLVNSHVKVEINDALVLRFPLRERDVNVKIQKINGKSIAVFKNPLSGLTCVAELA